MTLPAQNMLAGALSPYLQQHGDNPVHWREWSAQALTEARTLDRPILLSIGYAACHWCHVMAHESFEDPETANVMNSLFVNIKVDREERPDLDQIYMAALHAMGEQGGWPLTMFLAPDSSPFWGGTYFPKTARYGRPAFIDVLKAVAAAYRDNKEMVTKNTTALTRHVTTHMAGHYEPESFSFDDIDGHAQAVLGLVDETHGGIGTAPKFPNANMHESLWRLAARSNDDKVRKTAIRWTVALCQGGIYDHIGGGLARYSVDAEWLVPHFEKMLYDNAQFLRSLSIAYRLTEGDLFRQRIEETIAFLDRDLLLPNGAYAASLDADSQGEEGRHYVWTGAELRTLLGDDAGSFMKDYNCPEAGNWEGKIIPNRLHADPGNLGGSVEQSYAAIRNRLFDHRKTRTMPARDDKLLADWNGLVIRGLCDAAQAFQRHDWLDRAVTCFDTISSVMTNNGRLGHAHRNGVTTFPGLASDLASMINAAVSLYAARGEARFLETARLLHDELMVHFSDGQGGFYLTADDAQDVPIRVRQDSDEATSSATAEILEALSRLSLFMPALVSSEDLALNARGAHARAKRNIYGTAGIYNALATWLQPGKLIIIDPSIADKQARHSKENLNPLSRIALKCADPARMDILVRDPHDPRLDIAIARSDEDERKMAAYLCLGQTCLPPVHDAQALHNLLIDTSPSRDPDEMKE